MAFTINKEDMSEKNNIVKMMTKDTDLYLHGVSLPGGGLAICKDGAIISTQNICREHRTAHETTSSKHDMVNAWLMPTFHDLLGTGVVHLFLGGVGGKHTIEGKGLPLWRTQASWVS